MDAKSEYQIVKLANGTNSVRSLNVDETFHPGIGPVAEAEALYVRQLRLPERVRETEGEFVLWDVGLGAAANALTAIRLIREALADEQASEQGSKLTGQHKSLRLMSFDQTSGGLSFALKHHEELEYLTRFENALGELVENNRAHWADGSLQIDWTLALGDFPSLLAPNLGAVERRAPAIEREEEPDARSRRREEADLGGESRIRLLTSAATNRELAEPNSALNPPHAILFDPYSPKKNPEMWSVSLFADLFRRLDPNRPCALATYTRSTLARVAMLTGGFFVGVGHASGLKEETTVAANRLELIDEPLNRRWLEWLQRSGSAEPLREAIYRQAPLSPETWETLRRHPQFS